MCGDTVVKVEDDASSIAQERNVLEAVDIRRLALHLAVMVVVMVVMVRVLLVFGHAAAAVVRGHETVETVADDAFAVLACDVGDVRDGSAVLAPGRVRGERNHAATTCNYYQTPHRQQN